MVRICIACQERRRVALALDCEKQLDFEQSRLWNERVFIASEIRLDDVDRFLKIFFSVIGVRFVQVDCRQRVGCDRVVIVAILGDIALKDVDSVVELLLNNLNQRALNSDLTGNVGGKIARRRKIRQFAFGNVEIAQLANQGRALERAVPTHRRIGVFVERLFVELYCSSVIPKFPFAIGEIVERVDGVTVGRILLQKLFKQRLGVGKITHLISQVSRVKSRLFVETRVGALTQNVIEVILRGIGRLARDVPILEHIRMTGVKLRLITARAVRIELNITLKSGN